MLTAVDDPGGPVGERRVVVLGLTYANMMSLVQGGTLSMDLDVFGHGLPKLTLLVISGKDEEEMAARLRAGAEQQVVNDMRITEATTLPPLPPDTP